MKMSLSASRLKKPIVIASIALMCIALAVSMGVATFAATPTEKYEIGALLPITGPLADFGEASKAAIKLAEAEVNEFLSEDGATWRLKVLFKDTELNPEVALRKMEKLDKSGIQFVIGPISSGEVGSIKEYADTNEILVVSQSSTAPWLAEPDFIFRFVPSDLMQGRAIARLMYEDGIRTVVAVCINIPWASGLVDATETRFKEIAIDEGVSVEFQKDIWYDPEEPNFPDVAAAVNSAVQGASLPSVGVLYIGFNESVDFFTEACDAGTYPHLGTVNWYGSDATALNEDLINNEAVAEFCAATGFINTLFDPTRSDKYYRVHDELVAKLEREPDPYAYMAYDIVWALTYSLLEEGYDSEDVMEVLPAQTKWWSGQPDSPLGASGHIVLNEFGDRISGDYYLWRIVYEADEYEWKHEGTYDIRSDSIIWL